MAEFLPREPSPCQLFGQKNRPLVSFVICEMLEKGIFVLKTAERKKLRIMAGRRTNRRKQSSLTVWHPEIYGKKEGEKMKGLQGGKIYVTLAAMAIAVVTAVVYAVCYSATRYMSWAAFAILLVGVVLGLAMLALKMVDLTPWLLLGTGVVGTMFFVYYIYFFISSVAVGIQFSGFPPEFFATVVLFALTVLAAVVAIFVPQTSEKEA